VAAQRDLVIIGAGHNALTAAFYLAKAGLKPLLLERRDVVGGCAVTEEFAPGFRCSTLAHSAGAIAPQILRDMQLERRGVQWIQTEPCVFAPTPDGRSLFLYSDASKSAAEVALFSCADAEKYQQFQASLARITSVIAPLLESPPPEIDDPSLTDLLGLLKTGRGIRSLDPKDFYRLLRWAPMAIADVVAEWFTTEPLSAVVAARGIFGCAMGPWSAGTGAIFLLRAARAPVLAGSNGFVRGGLGRLTEAMAEAAREAGAEIRTGAEVAQIVVQHGAATGVTLKSGETVEAKFVVSAVDPKRTLLGLLDPVHVGPDFLWRITNYRCPGTVAKVNLALDGVPTFTALKESNGAAGINSGAALAGRIHIGPEIDYLERAFDASKYGAFSPHPYLEVTIPTLTDPSLAPVGKHVMSIYAQFAPYGLRAGSWDELRDALGDTVVKTLAAYAPDLPGKILHRQVLTPLDLERRYGLTQGHIFHGELALDQLFTMRPLLDWARYHTPIENLYLCGSGTHPGTGLNALSGWNAARAILKDLRD
jgi:phytoene dehydrogenase-like protein